MDAWKKIYSNEDKATKALPWLWENLDKENYSVWYCEYKYADELNMLFMTSNLINGEYLFIVQVSDFLLTMYKQSLRKTTLFWAIL